MPASIRDSYPPVPAGMVRLANCGSYDRALDSEHTVLAQAVGALHRFPTVYLQYQTRGFNIAGSQMRWDEASWGVLYYPGDGTRHGQRFSADAEGEAKARALFAKWTDPQAVSAKRQEEAMLEETVYAPARAARAAETAARLQAEKKRKAALRKHRAALRRGVAA